VTTIRRLLSPGDYPLVWQAHDGTSVSGLVTLAGGEAVTGMAYDLPAKSMSTGHDGWIDPSWTAWEPSVEPYGVARGQLRNNLDVALIDASVSHELPGQSRLQADLAVCGANLRENTDLLFDEITFQVTGLTALPGVPPLRYFELPASMRGGERPPEFRATWNDEAERSWPAGAEDTVRMHYLGSFSHPQLYTMSVTASPVVTVSGPARPLRQWLSEYARPVTELASFATGRPQVITWAEVKFAGGHGPCVVFGSVLTQQDEVASRPHPSELPLVHCGPDGAPLPRLLAGWEALKTEHPTFVDYFVSISTAALPVTSRFIALTAALEGFHSKKYGIGALSPTEFKKQKKGVFTRLREAAGVSDEDYQWLRAEGAYFGAYDLKDRLRFLAGALPEPVRARVNSAVDPIPPLLQGIVDQPEDIWQVMGKARNNLAHGNNTRQDNAQLAALTRLGHTVAVAFVLESFGVAAERLAVAIDRGDRSIL
jgi:hypothetical protein